MLLGIQIINIHESFFFAMFFHCQQLWPPKACGYGFIATTHGHWYPRRRPSACDTVETDVEPHGFLLRILAPEFSSMSACEISSYAVIPMVSSSDHFRLWATFFLWPRVPEMNFLYKHHWSALVASYTEVPKRMEQISSKPSIFLATYTYGFPIDFP